ncbi:hypothetical protein EDD21DRAFT_387259 [Dissophora ornata]|nr:hypothetical protein EDD21DRAFT_387259 [Dissophora ornata]
MSIIPSNSYYFALPEDERSIGFGTSKPTGAILDISGSYSYTDPQEATEERYEVLILIELDADGLATYSEVPSSANLTLDTEPQLPLHNEQDGRFIYGAGPASSTFSHHEDMSQVLSGGCLPYPSIQTASMTATPAMNLPVAPLMDITQAKFFSSHSTPAFRFPWSFYNSPDAFTTPAAFPHNSDLYLNSISYATTTTADSDITIANQTQLPSPGNRLIAGTFIDSTVSAAHAHVQPENLQHSNQAGKNMSDKGSNGMSTVMKLEFAMPLTAASFEKEPAFSSKKAKGSSQEPNRRPGRTRLPSVKVAMEDPLFLTPLIHTIPSQGPLTARKVSRNPRRYKYYIQAPYIHSNVKKDKRAFNSTQELKKARAEAAELKDD